VSVTVTTNPRPRTPGDRHFADQAVTSPTTPPISVFIHDEAFNGKTNDGQQVTGGSCPSQTTLGNALPRPKEPGKLRSVIVNPPQWVAASRMGRLWQFMVTFS
jgi:hypothetical protein